MELVAACAVVRAERFPTASTASTPIEYVVPHSSAVIVVSAAARVPDAAGADVDAVAGCAGSGRPGDRHRGGGAAHLREAARRCGGRLVGTAGRRPGERHGFGSVPAGVVGLDDGRVPGAAGESGDGIRGARSRAGLDPAYRNGVTGHANVVRRGAPAERRRRLGPCDLGDAGRCCRRRRICARRSGHDRVRGFLGVVPSRIESDYLDRICRPAREPCLGERRQRCDLEGLRPTRVPENPVLRHLDVVGRREPLECDARLRRGGDDERTRCARRRSVVPLGAGGRTSDRRQSERSEYDERGR